MKCNHDDWEYMEEGPFGFSEDCGNNCVTVRVIVMCIDCEVMGSYLMDTCTCPNYIDWEDSI